MVTASPPISLTVQPAISTFDPPVNVIPVPREYSNVKSLMVRFETFSMDSKGSSSRETTAVPRSTGKGGQK